MRGLAIVLLSVGVAAAQPAPDREQAKALYQEAEQAVQAGRFDDAIRGYTAAYDLTHDPVLFYKIGSANERAGNCDAALIYYGRYLQEATGADAFVEQTREHMRACGGDGKHLAAPSPSPTAPTATPTADAAAPPAPAVAATTPAPTAGLRGRNRAAWLFVASSVAFVTVGGVLAYSASSAENDVRDLYIGLDDHPPAYDASTRKSYEGLLDEGHRYQTLAWVSFGLAGASAITAGVLFWHGRHEAPLRIAPTASPSGAGVSLGGRF